MPNNNKNKSSDLASSNAASIGGAVAPSIATASNEQQKMIGNADQTLGVSRGQGEQAQQQFGTAGETIKTAKPVYQNFMETGGFSPSDETTYLNRATQGVSGTYDVLAKAAERQRAAAGGLGTGGEFSQMARQGTQAQAMATENAQADLTAQKNYNKFQGAAGTVDAARAETGVGQGLSSLYGQTNQLYNVQEGTVTAQGAQVLQALGLQYNTQAEAAQILAGLAAQPGTFDKILKTIAVLKPGYSSSGGATIGG